MALGIIGIIFIALAGLFLSIIVGTIAVTYPMFRKHKRKMADLERQIIATEIGAPPECSNITPPPVALRKSMTSPVNAGAGWGVLTSNEDLNTEYEKSSKRRRQQKRKSDMLSWPLPKRKGSKRGVSSKKLRATRLSTVVESPCLDQSKPTLEKEQTTSGLAISQDIQVIEEKTEPQTFGPAVLPRERSVSGSPEPSVSPSEALRPAPLRFSKRCSQIVETIENRRSLGRAVTVPAIFVATEDSVFGDTHRLSEKHKRNSRSISYGQATQPPTDPLPPLPSIEHLKRPTSAMARTSSNNSVTSFESVGSSLIKTSLSPNMKARNEFSERHPDLRLVPQVREHDTGLKSALLAGPRQTQVSLSPRMLSSTASLLFEPHTEEVKAHVELGKSFVEKLREVSRESDRQLASGDLADPGLLTEQQESPIKVLSTPTPRNSQIRKVSDLYGSPVERKRQGMLQSISGNNTALSRNASQNSVLSSESSASDSNPFQWETSPAKRSALKGSPNARKTHRRQNCVRISIRPTVLGPPSRNSSTSRMFEIAEEEAEGTPTPYDGDLSTMHQPPSVSAFEPKLNNTRSYRASLKPDSAALSMTEYGSNDNIFALYSRRNSRSPNGRHSVASSILSIPAFPTHDDPPISDDHANHSQFEEVRTYGIASSPSPTQRTKIPGLTLIDNDAASSTELQYPMIDLAKSPATSTHTPGAASSPASDDAPTPTQLLDRELAAGSLLALGTALPRNLSPSPKASPTTQLSQEFLSIPAGSTQEPMQNPMHTRPDFSPNGAAAAPSPAPSHHLVGPRAPPAPSIVKTIKGLRRDNSEAFRSIDSRSTQRYLGIGRTGSNVSNSSLASSPILGTFAGLDDEKENTPPVSRRSGSVWDSGEAYWNEKKEKGNGMNFETPSPKLVRGKSVTFDGVDYSNTPIAATPASLYDENGFFVGDDIVV